ncbi:hypothetical protein [Nonomuraea sp. NPDC023979]|uniref:hypothetical protein n=1 Tax=Nonomuraea sp. NPDC023979 TaxID=3154796 RepID=UPI00340096FE
MMRVLVPSRLRAKVRAWLDSHYVPIADHRRDLQDAHRETRALRDELAALRAEVKRLKEAPPPPAPDTCRLAHETAQALDGLLQNEVLLWQAVDELRSAGPGAVPDRGTEARPCA